MPVTVCLAGDTMLGRGVAEVLRSGGGPVVSDEICDLASDADLFLVNLECCISTRGEPWGEPGKPFFFRAPPSATDVLNDLGVDCVTLANNHALDFGYDALLDTFGYLDEAGIAWIGAGPDSAAARRSRVLSVGDVSIETIAIADHPASYAATDDVPGIAYADLRAEVPGWVLEAVRASTADVVVVTPHWGPNMVGEPVAHVSRAASDLTGAGATLIAGHSAHVFHGVDGSILFDLGDFIDDYATDPVLRNDLGLLWFVIVESRRVARIEAVPLVLDYCFTRVATGADAAWIEHRFRSVCDAFGSRVSTENGRLVVEVG
ncbi:MAG: CapA family protein [Actinomycetota bacterium]